MTDYSYVPLVWMAPRLAGFAWNRRAVRIVRIFSATVLVYSLLTDAKWGAVRVIPYKVHAALDLGVGVAALAIAATPAVIRNRRARKTLLLMGLTGLTVGILSLIGARRS